MEYPTEADGSFLLIKHSFIYSKKKKNTGHSLCSFIPCKSGSQGLEKVFLSFLPSSQSSHDSPNWSGRSHHFLYGLRSPKED